MTMCDDPAVRAIGPRRISAAGLVLGAIGLLVAPPASGQRPSGDTTAAAAAPTVQLQGRQSPLTGDTTGSVFTLGDALRVARQNNPAFLETLDSAQAAGATLRAAYGQLLPQLSASAQGIYGEGGQTPFSGSLLGATSNYVESFYQLGLTYTLNAATLFTPGFAHANRDAAEADVAAQNERLVDTVAEQYVTIVEDQAKAALQDSLVADVRAQLELTRARVTAGAGTPLDSVRAAVTVGQQETQALQAHNQVEIDKLRLFQELGVAAPPSVQFAETYPVAPPPFSLDSVLALARGANPQLTALRLRSHAANVGMHRAWGLYTPTFQLATGTAGYTYQYTNPAFVVASDNAALAQQFGSCMTLDTLGRAAGLPPRNCGASALTLTQADSVQRANRLSPFAFQNIPRSVVGTLTLPLFDGFQREQRVEQAKVDRTTAVYNQRARELQLTADVTSAYLTLVTAVRTVDIQEQNTKAARDALSLAEERYRLGASTIVDVADARAAYERADNDRISAVYDYHKAFAALESAVGHRLR